MSRPAKILVASLAALLVAFAGTAMARDRNNDRIPDRWEKKHDLSLKVKQTRRDQDRDGLRNRNEWRSRTDPRDADGDDDGVADGDEDGDRDHVDNDNEQDEGTNPGERDTDDDGKPDGREDADDDDLNNRHEDETANQPDDEDTDDDGIEDGDENAGVIASFDPATGRLTINVGHDETVSGLVTDATEISCETEDQHEGQDEPGDHDEGTGEEPGDDEGSGDHEEGADEPGDDEEGPADSEEGGDEPGEEVPDEPVPDSAVTSEEGGGENACSVDDLVPGAVVHEAELDGDVFDEIELVS